MESNKRKDSESGSTSKRVTPQTDFSYDDSDDESTSSHLDVDDMPEEDDEKEVKDMASTETKRVRVWRVLLLLLVSVN